MRYLLAVVLIVIGLNHAVASDFGASNTGCANGKAPAFLTGASLCLVGPTDAKMVAALNGLDLKKAKLVVLQSEGGAVEAALTIAESLERLHLPVQISSYCISSCANYLAIIGHPLRVLPGAILGFHGAPPETYEAFYRLGYADFEKSVVDYNKEHGTSFVAEDEYRLRWRQAEHLLLRQTALCKRRGVDEALLRAFSNKLNNADDVDMELMRARSVLWVPSRTDFKRYGVEIGDYPIDDVPTLRRRVEENGWHMQLID